MKELHEKTKGAQFQGTPEECQRVKNAKCILMGISMEQDHQTKEELHAFIDEVNKKEKYPKLEKVFFVVTDYLHRHYTRLNTDSSDQAKEKAEEMGKDWREVNKEILEKKLNFKLKEVKWKDLIEDSEPKDLIEDSEQRTSYAEQLKIIKGYYDNDREFQKIVDKHSKDFGENKYKKYFGEKKYEKEEDKNKDKEACQHAAKSYFLEESTIILKFKSIKFDVFTYPGKCNKGIKYIYPKLFDEEKDPLNFISYRFRPATEKEKEVRRQEIKAQRSKAGASATPDESRRISCMIPTNFGGTTTKTFPKHNNSLAFFSNNKASQEEDIANELQQLRKNS